LRLGDTLIKTRLESLDITAAVEQIDETNNLPSFDEFISHDRYMAARLGANYAQTASPIGFWSVVANLSHGLGGLGSLSLADVGHFSRAGASDSFTKFNAQFSDVVPLTKSIDFRIYANGQSTFGHAVFRAEQFALEGASAVSAYVGGETAVDEGITARAELSGRVATDAGKNPVFLAPYIFAAGGTGRINEPTAVELGDIRAAAFGLGLRANLARPALLLNVEYAHGISNYAVIGTANRVNFTTSLRF